MGMMDGMLDVNLIELLTLAGVVYAAAGVHRLQRRFDELAGKVAVNAPGLHH